ncbi:alanine:cation symporter family protein [Sphingobacterium alkalisoli]|uniref:Alanine:cation symporter family protein n=1 Tax=Sphingobacterium alkalisoli TaxID=1874115 RepID=A0A4U0H8Y7_9SPHI|nr:alanine/glycine:cation symporter family protein [Sphingobacterium alkalisoli]TJY66932.1 alanine:cation symporter family protein [Sphingobacterium alkalisoli]GGH13307.1 sodium:alanine symporter [Sphingobacterium alkalisoli]
MENIINAIYNIVWSDALVYLCMLSGLYFTIRFKFPQIRYIKDMITLLFKGGKSEDGSESEKGISSFQAFSLAISGRVGTGNIAGVATAIGMGGPGAVFWMWMIAIVGSASAIIEATLGQLYKEVKDGQYRGGPAFYILKGLNNKPFAWAFAIVTVLSTGFLLPSVQSNSISIALESSFNFSPITTGLCLVFFLAIIIIGGVKRISKVAEFVVPFMAGSYILMAIVIIGFNISQIPAIFSLILDSAFGGHAAFGGIVGTAISWGVKRGIYSNEAGQGTAPHAAAAAAVSHPIKQGLVQGFSVYVDTLFVCTATAFMILFTGMYNVENPAGGFIVQNLPNAQMGPEFTQYAVSQHFPNIGSAFVALALTFFAFTTIMAYYYIAETNISFISGKRKNTLLLWGLRILILVSTYVGCVTTAKDVWTLGDIGVGLMAWLNIIAIIFLHGKVYKLMQDYDSQKKQKIDPKFNNSLYQFKNANFWNKHD